jgi:hypothetical protein
MVQLAARQYGVVTRAQLATLGYTDELLERALARGTLQGWHRDVFAVGHGVPSPHALCQAAVLLRGEGSLISHQSAAWLWGLEPRLEIPVNVTVPWRGSSRTAIGLHHCPGLREKDRATTERLPVTAVPRTLLDYAWTAEQHRLESAIGRADDIDLLDPEAVDRIIEETPAHPGGRALRRALAFHRENRTGPSGAEREMSCGGRAEAA